MAGQTHSTTEGMHEAIEVPAAEHGAGFPPFDSTTFASQLLWLAITFGVFYWIMKNVAVPRIAGIWKTAGTVSPVTFPKPTGCRKKPTLRRRAWRGFPAF